MGFGPTGSDLSFTGGVSTAWDGREGQYSYGHSVGTGLTYNANDTWDLSFQQSVGISDITQGGFHGIGTGVGIPATSLPQTRITDRKSPCENLRRFANIALPHPE